MSYSVTTWTAACQASHHQLLEFTQTHVHWVSDAIQPSYPLLSPSPPAFSLQASGSFAMSQFSPSGGQCVRVSASVSVLQMNIQDWFPLGWTDWISLQSKGLSRVFSNTTGQKHQFFGTQLSWETNSHIHTWLLEKSWLWLDGLLLAKWCLCFLICYLGLNDLSLSQLPVMFLWLYRASPSLAAKNIISLFLVLTIRWCPCVESSLVLLEEGVCYDQCILLAELY